MSRSQVERPLLCAAAGNGKIGVGKEWWHHLQTPLHSGARDLLACQHQRQSGGFHSLAARGRPQTRLWNADSGSITEAAAFTQRDGRTHIPLHLDASESIFVVFGESIGADVNGSRASNTPGLEVLAALDGPWTVRFDGQGAPQETIFATLTDWAKHPDESIRHYSGTAVYQTGFTLEAPARNQRTILELGKAAVMATVVVNGREAGILWTTPWKIDISDFVKAGNNRLEIRVSNTWNNRLVADASKPPNERLSYISQSYQFNRQAPLAPGGLLGPVRVKRHGSLK